MLDQPNHSLHVLNEIGEADLGSRPGNADRAEQAHRPFLPSEDMLDRRTDRRFAGIRLGGARRSVGLPFGFLRR